jgi:hypothetical protein
MYRLFATLALMVAAIALSGCFTSDYDIAAQVGADTPIPAARYKSEDGKLYRISVAGTVYTAANETDKGEGPTHFQFFRVPESDTALIVQVWTGEAPAKGRRYVYMFASVSDGNVSFTNAAYDDLPPYLRSLAEHRAADADIGNGARDTLYVLRETLRRGTRFEVGGSLTRITP